LHAKQYKNVFNVK